MTRIVIVDDHPISREGLAIRLRSESDLDVCGYADDVAQALRVIETTAPDLVIVDVSLKNSNGLTLVEHIQTYSNPPKVLVWSMFDDSLYADRALRAGAMGYINKQSASESIIDAIRQVLNGKTYVSPEMSNALVSRIGRGKEGIKDSPIELLSDRELETFRLIGRGLTTKEIAAQMKLSPKTVETYRARIKEKLGVTKMSELTRFAAQWVLENG